MAGDVDGDGRADAALGMPAYNDSAGQWSSTGAGRLAGAPDQEDLARSDSTLFAGGSSGIGTPIAAAGDVNGDGLGDLLVGDTERLRVRCVWRIGPFRSVGPQQAGQLEADRAGVVLYSSKDVMLGSGCRGGRRERRRLLRPADRGERPGAGVPGAGAQTLAGNLIDISADAG
jgi:hypothetical protein